MICQNGLSAIAVHESIASGSNLALDIYPAHISSLSSSKGPSAFYTMINFLMS